MKSYCDINYVYSVREVLSGKWYIVVYWRNPNGSRGGVCRILDELDGPRCSAKAYSSAYKAQKYLDRLAKLYRWKAYRE